MPRFGLVLMLEDDGHAFPAKPKPITQAIRAILVRAMRLVGISFAGLGDRDEHVEYEGVTC